MHQRYLNLPNFRTARDYRYQEHVRRGAEVAAAHGLASDYVESAWQRRTDDWYGIHLVAYIPRDANAGLFGISRRYDGVYASVTCSTPEQASAALVATTRDAFEMAGDQLVVQPADIAAGYGADPDADALLLDIDAAETTPRRPRPGEQLSLI